MVIAAMLCLARAVGAPLIWTDVTKPAISQRPFRFKLVQGSLLLATGKEGSIYHTLDGELWGETALDFGRPVGDFAELDGTIYGAANDGRFVKSTDGLHWSTYSVNLSGQELVGLAYAKGQFVGVEPGRIWTSADAIHWVNQTEGLLIGDIVGVDVVGDRYVAPTTDGGVYVSNDAYSWDLLPIDPDPTFLDEATYVRGFRYVNGHCFAVGNARSGNIIGSICTSVDGVNWKSAKFPGVYGFQSVAFGKGLYVVVGEGVLGYSDDGVSWTLDKHFTTASMVDVAFLKDRFLAVTATGSVFSSVDGKVWSSRDFGANDLRAVAATDTGFISVGRAGTIATSPTGAAWQQATSGTTRDLFGAYSHDGLVLVGGEQGSIFTSSNQQDWVRRYSNTGSSLFDIRGIVHGGSLYVATAGVVTSTNGLHWESTLGSGIEVGIIHDGKKFIRYGAQGAYWSTNAATWTRIDPSIQVLGIAVGNGLYVGVGSSQIVVSTDGLKWHNVPASSPDLNAVIYAEGAFVAVGENGRVGYSTNGTNWTYSASGTTRILRSIAFAHGTYVAVGDAGTIAYSASGVGRLGHGQFIPGQGFHFGFRGIAGQKYLLQYSTDLVRWHDLQHVQATQGETPVVDMDAVADPSRQYRYVEE